MRLSLLLGGICHTHGGAEAWTSLESAGQRDDVICEDGEASLRCSGRDDVIKVTEAIWGRENADQCAALDSVRMENTNCRSDHLEKISSICKNRASCKIPVTADMLGDPCPGTRKYFKVGYECVKFAFGPTKPAFQLGKRRRLRPPITARLRNHIAWAVDPLRSSANIYQVAGDRLIVYDEGAGGELNIKQEIELETRPTKQLVVWGEEVYYISQGKLIKYSLDRQIQSSVDLAELAPDYVPGLFQPNFRLAVSELGVFGVYKSKGARWAIIQIRSELKGQVLQTTKAKFSNEDETLIIGRILYLIRGGGVQYAVDLRSEQQIPLTDIGSLGSYTQLAYLPRHNEMLFVTDNGELDITELEFLDRPPGDGGPPPNPRNPAKPRDPKTPLPSSPPDPTVHSSTTPRVNITRGEERTIGNCPFELLDGVPWAETPPDSRDEQKCPGTNNELETVRYCDPFGNWQEPAKNQCAYAEFPEKLRQALKDGKRVDQILEELIASLAKEESDRERVKLVDRVSSTLMTFDMANNPKVNKALLSLLDELHCWSLVESENFMWLISQSNLANDDPGSGNDSLVLRPSRCSRDTLYIFNRRARGLDQSGDRKWADQSSSCHYFVSETEEGAAWAKCDTCEQCDDNFFFKVKLKPPTQKIQFNLLTIAVVISISIMTLLGAILIVAREKELPYPETLRFMLLANQIVLYGSIMITWSFARDFMITLSSMAHFQIMLCIAHCLYQKSKPVTTELDCKIRRYLCLVVFSSLVVLITIASIFFVVYPQLSPVLGWLSLSLTWSASLLTPVLCAFLFSSIWLILAASQSPLVRPLAVKFALYLTLSTLTLTCTLMTFLDYSLDIPLAVLILVTSFLTLATLSPDCAFHTQKNSPTRQNRTNHTNGWYHVTDNRSSLTDFRYIPVVHNIHSTNYVKPRTMDRLYTEIIPDPADNTSQMMLTNQGRPFMTAPNQIACNLSTVDWGSTPPQGTDSGVHTAQNSSDSSSSDRGSPVLAIMDEKAALLREQQPDILLEKKKDVENNSNTVDC